MVISESSNAHSLVLLIGIAGPPSVHRVIESAKDLFAGRQREDGGGCQSAATVGPGGVECVQRTAVYTAVSAVFGG